MTEPATVDASIAAALLAYADLAALGEEVDDEWTYVTDLTAAWRDRLDAVASGRLGAPIDPEARAAIDAAIDVAARIEDPHRAIDWLSTFPQVVLVALGEPS